MAERSRAVTERYERRRAEIIDIGAKAFAEHGFHATTVDRLVEATGLQRGGLYHYIDGKLDLLIGIHERFIEPLLDEARRIKLAGLPADQELRALAYALMSAIASFRDHVTVFLHEWRIIESEPAWSDIRKARREFEQIITDTLESGRKQGLFAFGDLRISALAFLGMINYSYQWYDPAGRLPAESLADQFADIFIDGIRAPGAESRKGR